VRVYRQQPAKMIVFVNRDQDLSTHGAKAGRSDGDIFRAAGP
jgi:hypothetical protein